MSHSIAAARQLRDFLSMLYLGLFVIFAGMIYYVFGTFNLIVIGGLAALGTGFAVLRAYGPIKADLTRAKMRDAEEQERLDAEQQAQRNHLFGMACVEIAKMMSKLSDGDLSMFMTADKFCKNNGADSYQFRTSKGSPVHEVLVAMVDVGCTEPVEMKRLAPEVDLTIATYELTERGKHALELFIRDAFRYRQQR